MCVSQQTRSRSFWDTASCSLRIRFRAAATCLTLGRGAASPRRLAQRSRSPPGQFVFYYGGFGAAEQEGEAAQLQLELNAAYDRFAGNPYAYLGYPDPTAV